MKNAKFLKVGLIAILLNFSINTVNAKKIDSISHLTNNASSQLVSQKNSDVQKENELGKVLKIAGFTVLGAFGLGAAFITYIFYGMVNASKPIKRNRKQQNNYDFLEACLYGKLDKIKYLLNKESVDINQKKDLAIARACAHNHLDVVKYLLASPELKKHSNIHSDNDIAFKSACKKNRKEIIQYLIFDYKIDKTKEIKEFLKDYIEIDKMFEKREYGPRCQN